MAWYKGCITNFFNFFKNVQKRGKCLSGCHRIISSSLHDTAIISKTDASRNAIKSTLFFTSCFKEILLTVTQNLALCYLSTCLLNYSHKMLNKHVMLCRSSNYDNNSVIPSTWVHRCRAWIANDRNVSMLNVTHSSCDSNERANSQV